MAVAVAFQSSGSGLEQDCRQCVTSADLRHQWGCDQPTVEPLFWLNPCPWCNGMVDKCDHCQGEGRVGVPRCPNKMATSKHLELVAAVEMVEQGILPDPGGWQDQASLFVQAYPLVASEVAKMRNSIQEQATKKAHTKGKAR